jgi:AcrR family transcriptional regulator
MTPAETTDRILDAAERLLSERGLAGVSLRAVTSAAGVNLAAVNYHFGSKEALVGALLRRRIEPMNRARLERLDELEARDSARAPELEEVLEAFIAPALRQAEVAGLPPGGFMRLMSRLHAEPNEFFERTIVPLFRGVLERFVPALQRSLPGLEGAELLWCVHFAISAIKGALADQCRLEAISHGLCNARDTEGAIARLVPFVAAGMRDAERRALASAGDKALAARDARSGERA